MKAGFTSQAVKRRLQYIEGTWCFLCMLLFVLHSEDLLWVPLSSDFYQVYDDVEHTQHTPITVCLFCFLMIEPWLSAKVYHSSCILRWGEENMVQHWPGRQYWAFVLSGPLYVLPRFALRLRPSLNMAIAFSLTMVLYHTVRTVWYLKRVIPVVRRALPANFVTVGGTLVLACRIACDAVEALYVAKVAGVGVERVSEMYVVLLLGTAVLNHLLSAYGTIVGDETARAVAERDAVKAELKAKDTKLSAAEAADMARQRFMRYIFHEVRVPFNSLVMGLGLLEEEESSNLSPDGIVTLDMLVKAASAAKTILNDVLDVAKIDSGAFQLSMVPTRLRDVVQGTILSMAPMAADHDTRVRLISDVHPGLPQWVVADKVRLQQVLANLVSNAIKFAPHDGSGEVVVAVSILPESRLHVEEGSACLLLDTSTDVPQAAGTALESQGQKSHADASLPSLYNLHGVQWRCSNSRRASVASVSSNVTGHKSSTPTVEETSHDGSIFMAPVASPRAVSRPQTVKQEAVKGFASHKPSSGSVLQAAFTAIAGPAKVSSRSIRGWLSTLKSARFMSTTSINAITPVETVMVDTAITVLPPVTEAPARPPLVVASCGHVSLTSAKRLPSIEPMEITDAVKQSLDQQGFSLMQTEERGCPCQAHGQSNDQTRWATLVISVKDNGAGIAPSDAPLLFKAFRQLDAGLQYKGKGTGLGLAICHEIISLHGGRVGVRSSGVPGEGAEFVVLLRLPVVACSTTPSNLGPRSTTPSPNHQTWQTQAGRGVAGPAGGAAGSGRPPTIMSPWSMPGAAKQSPWGGPDTGPGIAEVHQDSTASPVRDDCSLCALPKPIPLDTCPIVGRMSRVHSSDSAGSGAPRHSSAGITSSNADVRAGVSRTSEDSRHCSYVPVSPEVSPTRHRRQATVVATGAGTRVGMLSPAAQQPHRYPSSYSGSLFLPSSIGMPLEVDDEAELRAQQLHNTLLQRAAAAAAVAQDSLRPDSNVITVTHGYHGSLTSSIHFDGGMALGRTPATRVRGLTNLSGGGVRSLTSGRAEPIHKYSAWSSAPDLATMARSASGNGHTPDNASRNTCPELPYGPLGVDGCTIDLMSPPRVVVPGTEQSSLELTSTSTERPPLYRGPSFQAQALMSAAVVMSACPVARVASSQIRRPSPLVPVLSLSPQPEKKSPTMDGMAASDPAAGLSINSSRVAPAEVVTERTARVHTTDPDRTHTRDRHSIVATSEASMDGDGPALPVRVSAPESPLASGRATMASADSTTTRPLRLLVVDDVTENRRLLARILKSRLSTLDKQHRVQYNGVPLTFTCRASGTVLTVVGMDVEEVEDGYLAVARVTGAAVAELEAAAREAGPGATSMVSMPVTVPVDPTSARVYDAITMDAEMPVMSGFTATRIIRAAGYSGPIFGCTGNALEADQALFKASGVDRVFVKPVAVTEVVAALMTRLQM